jgi:exopolysaccharide biosynthesis polyprenyl glycosylphosphotransferase
MFAIVKIISEHDRTLFEEIRNVDVVFICPAVENNLKKKIIHTSTTLGKESYIVPDFYEISLLGATIGNFEDIQMIRMKNWELTFEQKLLKRIFDIVFSIVVLIVSLPFSLLCAIAIKLYDRGPIFYFQERISIHGKRFNVIKFRTMIIDAEKNTGPSLAKQKDSRITPIGAFLRSTRFDEIPQFVNVLKGEMSVVGPRPERIFFINKISNEIEDYDLRHNVKAGITGLAQIIGKYTSEPKDKLKFDQYYIKNYSFMFDMKIILQTIKILFMKSYSAGKNENKEKLNACNSSLFKDRQDGSFGGGFDPTQILEPVIQKPSGIKHFEESGGLKARDSDKVSSF